MLEGVLLLEIKREKKKNKKTKARNKSSRLVHWFIGLLTLFNGISTFIGYLRPKPSL